MRTIVLLATFLLAASANPIADHNGSTEDTADSQTEDVSNAGHDSEWSTGDNATNDTKEEQTYNDNVPGSPSDAGEGESGNAGGGDAFPGDTHTSLVSSVSASPTRDAGDTSSGNAGGAVTGGEGTEDMDTWSVNSASATPTTGSSVSETSSTPVSNASEGSTSPTTNSVGDLTSKTAVSITDEIFPDSPNKTVTLPPDSDPTDCKNGSQPGHIFRECEFVCEGDEMQVAPPNATCYLPLNVNKTPIAMARIADDNRKKGQCVDGKCVDTTTAVFDTPSFNTSDPVPVENKEV